MVIEIQGESGKSVIIEDMKRDRRSIVFSLDPMYRQADFMIYQRDNINQYIVPIIDAMLEDNPEAVIDYLVIYTNFPKWETYPLYMECKFLEQKYRSEVSYVILAHK